MTLTVTEKQHWKERIGRKIAQAIADFVDRQEPGYLERVTREARQAAIKHLGMTELLEREQLFEEQEKKLRQDKQELYRQLTAAARKVPLDEVQVDYHYHCSEWERAIRERQTSEERRLLATSPLGEVVLKLRREEEELLDTVWLATSPKQIKNLWQGVTELVSGELTALQKQAMEADDSIEA